MKRAKTSVDVTPSGPEDRPQSGSDRLVRRVLAFVEFSGASDPDMGYAIGLASQLRAELILFAVIDRAAMVALIGRHRGSKVGAKDLRASDTLTANLVEDARQILQRLVDQAVDQGVPARGHATISDEVPEQILKEAIVQHVDLIVIEPGERQGFLSYFLGSTVEEVLSAAPCSVLVAQRRGPA